MYDAENNSFRIGEKLLKLTEVDVSLIFGFPVLGKKIFPPPTTSRCSLPEKFRGFLDTHFHGKNNLTKKIIEDRILFLIRKNKVSEDVMVLIIMLVVVSFLHPNNQGYLPWGYIPYLLDIKEMNSVSWPTFVIDTLKRGMEKYTEDWRKMPGCSMLMLYWICERTTLVQAKTNVSSYPRFVKWSLSSLDNHLTCTRLRSIEGDQVFEELRNITEEENLLLDGSSSDNIESVCEIDVRQRSSERTDLKRKYKTVKIYDCRDESCGELNLLKSEFRKIKEEVDLLGKSLDDEKNKRMKIEEELKKIKEKIKKGQRNNLDNDVPSRVERIKGEKKVVSWKFLDNVVPPKVKRIKGEKSVVSWKSEYDIDRCDALLRLDEQKASVVKTFLKLLKIITWIPNTDMGLMEITKEMVEELLFDRNVYGQIIDWFWERKVRFMDASESFVYVNTIMTKSGTTQLTSTKEWLLIPCVRNALENSKCCNILFPIHQSNHWSLLEVDLENSMWTLYDSLQPRRTTRSSLHLTNALKIKSVLEEEVTKLKEEGRHVKLDKKKEISIENCAQQSNCIDCGVFVMIAVERRVKGHDLADAVSKDLVKEIRGKLAYEILSDEPYCRTVDNYAC